MRKRKVGYGSLWMLLSFVIATKESNQRKRLVKPNASTRSAGSYAFVDAPHHSKS
jgi:hypothetical protein